MGDLFRLRQASGSPWCDFIHRVRVGLIGFAVLVVLGAVPEIAARAVPASIWYELREVHVGDGPEIDHLRLRADRTIHREFVGYYIARVWDEGRTAPVCTGSDAGQYRPTAKPVIERTFGWWVAHQRPPCATQVHPGGRYIMETCVTVIPRGFWLRLLEPTVCRWSNVFTITASAGG